MFFGNELRWDKSQELFKKFFVQSESEEIVVNIIYIYLPLYLQRQHLVEMNEGM